MVSWLSARVLDRRKKRRVGEQAALRADVARKAAVLITLLFLAS